MRQQQAFHALGSDAVLTLVHQRSEAYGSELFSLLREYIAAFEQRFSRFLPGSELTSFNRQAGSRVEASEEFRALLFTARELGLETDGLYNPFILPALQRAGYVGSWPAPAAHHAITNFSGRSVAMSEQITVNGLQPAYLKIRQLILAALAKGICSIGWLICLRTNSWTAIGCL